MLRRTGFVAATIASAAAPLQAGSAETVPAVTSSREQPCPAAANQPLERAIAMARSDLDTRWLKTSAGYLAQYEIPGEAKNPLLPEPEQSDAGGPINGYVFTPEFSCSFQLAEPPDKARITFRAESLRFNEALAGWTTPTPGAVIFVAIAREMNGAWRVAPTSGDDTVFPPGTELRKPAAENLPPHAVWPAKDCKVPKLWDGTKCSRPRNRPAGAR